MSGAASDRRTATRRATVLRKPLARQAPSALAWAALPLLAVGAAGGALPLGGCGGKGPQGPKKPATPQEAARAGKVLELQNQLAILEKQIADFPLNKKGVVAEARRHQATAREVGDPSLEQAFAALPDKAAAAFDAALDSETEKGLAEANEARSRGDLDDAEAKLTRLLGKLEGTPKEARVEEALAELRLAGRAGKVYDRVISPKLESFGRDERWELARGLLESFLLVEAFRGHPKAKEVEAKLKDVGPKADAARQRRQKEDAIDWAPVFTGKPADLENFSHSDPDRTRAEGDLFVVKSGDGERDVARLTVGDDDWGDVIVEVVFRVRSGSISFVARGLDGDWQEVVRVREYDTPTAEHARIRIEIRGNAASYRVSQGGAGTGTSEMAHPRGPFQLLVLPESEVEVRSMWVKVLTRIEDTGGDGAGSGKEDE